MARTAVVGFCCSETEMKELKESSQPGSSRALWGYGSSPSQICLLSFTLLITVKFLNHHPVPLPGELASPPSSHHRHPDGKKRVSSLTRSSVSSRDACVISFEVPTSPGLHVLTTTHCKEADDSPHSRCDLGPQLSETVPAWATSSWGHTGCHQRSSNPSMAFVLRLSLRLCAALWGSDH